MLRGALLAAGMVLATGCASTVIHQTMDANRLAPSPAGRAARATALRCPHRLDGVEDARDGGSQSGGLGRKAFEFANAADVVRARFVAAGFETSGDAPPLRIRIRQLYLGQNTTTKVPVAVYEVVPANGGSFIVRAQPASMNWAGSIDEAYGAYSAAMVDAQRQVIDRLNLSCNTSAVR
ncbi:hypothetical protein [Lysobacter sp. HA18]